MTETIYTLSVKKGGDSLKIIVTGGAGFIGRWVVKRLLEDGHSVYVLDNLSNGAESNLENLRKYGVLLKFIKGDIRDKRMLEHLFEIKPDLCYHLAACINVQDSIDHPASAFENDTVGTFNILERCRKCKTRLIFMSTCMVYDRAANDCGIDESHPVKPLSPYAGSKLAAENLVLSFWYSCGLPVVILRPFNTYGPFQKSGGEGGVVPIFIKKSLDGGQLNIYGDGCQTRDLLYVEDCAEFVVLSGYMDSVKGHIINAGLGRDISINNLAMLIVNDKSRIVHIPHIHPQSEISRLLCNRSKAETLLGWVPATTLEQGIEKCRAWMKGSQGLF